MLRSLTPMLETWDMKATVAFYRDSLGFNCDSYCEEDGWVSLSCGGVELMFATPNQHMGNTAPAFTGSLYIRSDDVDALWLQFKDKARVCYPLENFSYGMREFAIFDNNGYLLQFGQELQ